MHHEQMLVAPDTTPDFACFAEDGVVSTGIMSALAEAGASRKKRETPHLAFLSILLSIPNDLGLFGKKKKEVLKGKKAVLQQDLEVTKEECESSSKETDKGTDEEGDCSTKESMKELAEEDLSTEETHEGESSKSKNTPTETLAEKKLKPCEESCVHTGLPIANKLQEDHKSLTIEKTEENAFEVTEDDVNVEVPNTRKSKGTIEDYVYSSGIPKEIFITIRTKVKQEELDVFRQKKSMPKKLRRFFSQRAIGTCTEPSVSDNEDESDSVSGQHDQQFLYL